MASERKTATNRANAQKSTGPRSAAGKRRSAQNAVRHGLSRGSQSPAAMAAARELAAAFLAEDPELDEVTALRIAEASLRLRDVAIVADQALTLRMEELSDEPLAIREDLARLELLDRLNALHAYERRAAAKLRKALRRVPD